MTAKDKKIIEDSEAQGIPIFVLTAKDRLSVETIARYNTLCIEAGCDTSHTVKIAERFKEFTEWQGRNPNRVKKPD